MHAKTSVIQRRLLISLLALAAPGSAFARLTLEIGRTQGAPAYPQTNGRQVARSSDGTWFVAYDGLAAGSRAVFVAVSRKSDPGLAGEFHPAASIVGGPQAVLRVPAEEARLATLVVGPGDVLHLVWQSSKPAAIWHAQCRLARDDPAAQLLRPESWTAADGRTGGAERVDAGDSETQLGDAAGGADGSLWVAFTRSVPLGAGASYSFQESGRDFTYSIPGPKAAEVWLARCAAGSWTRKPLTRPGPFAAPVVDLDRSGTLHAAFRGGWFLLYRRIPDLAARFGADDLTAALPEAAWAGTAYASYSVIGWGKQGLVAFEKVEHAMVYCHFDGTRWTRQPPPPDRTRTDASAAARSRWARRRLGLLDQQHPKSHIRRPLARNRVERPARLPDSPL